MDGDSPAKNAQAKAIEILEKLVEDFPDVSDYRHDLSKVYVKSIRVTLDPPTATIRMLKNGCEKQ